MALSILVVVLVVLAFGIVTYVLVTVFAPPEPTPEISVSIDYEEDGNFSNRNCRKYNATLTFSTSVSDSEFTVTSIWFAYSSDAGGDQVHATVNLTVTLELDASVSITIDSCRGIQLEASICADFQTTVSFDYHNSRGAFRTDPLTLPGFEICG